MKNKVKIKELGITLVALVITIIILLILAGVTISTALGQNGLFQRAKIAGEKYKEAEADETEKLGEIEKEIDEINEETLLQIVTYTEHQTIKGKDKLGNKVVIPGGFKFVGKEDDTVEDGIVIQDDEGNEFVWIPVSNIDGDNDAETNPNAEDLIKLKNGSKVEITLGRYSFKNDEIGTPELRQAGKNSEESVFINNYYQEKSNYTNGGIGAKDLGKFVESVEDNNGYYIARYEASFGSGDGPSGSYGSGGIGDTSIMTDQKPAVKKSTAKNREEINYTPGTLWNFITQGDASKVSQNMYKDNEYVESDLINSYAWDTAIVYIQKMINENYAYKYMYDDSMNLRNTGETEEDEKCHIFDMAGNLAEWTTENSVVPNNDVYPCVLRGNNCVHNDYYTAYRGHEQTTYNMGTFGFRPVLYLK